MDIAGTRICPAIRICGAIPSGVAPLFYSTKTFEKLEFSADNFKLLTQQSVAANRRLRFRYIVSKKRGICRCRAPPSDLFWILPQKQIGGK